MPFGITSFFYVGYYILSNPIKIDLACEQVTLDFFLRYDNIISIKSISLHIRS